MYMPNMKSLSLTDKKLWSRLKFLDIKVKGHGKGHLGQSLCHDLKGSHLKECNVKYQSSTYKG